MKNRNLMLSVFAVLLLGALFTPAAFAGEGCDDSGEMEEMCKLLKEWADKTIGDASFVASCMGFAEDPTLCDAADAPGTGLVCPPAPEPTTTNHDCQILDSTGFEASFGTKAGQVIKLAGQFSTHFVMIGEEKSIPTHNHQPTCETTGSCAEEYVKRQERVTVFFAAAQKGKISVDPLESFAELETFKGTLSGKKVTFFQTSNFHYCTKVDHGEPRSCVKGPITPGGSGTCTGDGTCEQPVDECNETVPTDEEFPINTEF